MEKAGGVVGVVWESGGRWSGHYYVVIFIAAERDSVRWERSNGPETKRPNVGGRKRERSIERGTVYKPSGKRVPVWENLCACVCAERECIKRTCVKHMPSPLSPSCHQQKQLLFYHQPLNIKNTRACVRVPEWVCKSSTKKRFDSHRHKIRWMRTLQKRLHRPYFSFLFPSYFFFQSSHWSQGGYIYVCIYERQSFIHTVLAQVQICHSATVTVHCSVHLCDMFAKELIDFATGDQQTKIVWHNCQIDRYGYLKG